MRTGFPCLRKDAAGRPSRLRGSNATGEDNRSPLNPTEVRVETYSHRNLPKLNHRQDRDAAVRAQPSSDNRTRNRLSPLSKEGIRRNPLLVANHCPFSMAAHNGRPVLLCRIRGWWRRDRLLHDPGKHIQRDWVHFRLDVFRGNQEFSFAVSLLFFRELC